MKKTTRIVNGIEKLSNTVNEAACSIEQAVAAFKNLNAELPRILQAENGLWYIYHNKNIQPGNIDDDSVDGPYNSFEECFYMMDDNPDLELPMTGKM